MAVVQSLYDISFKRGQSALDAAATEFIDFNRRQNKEMYLRQLAAASPKNEFVILRELIRERAGAVEDLIRLQSSLARASQPRRSSTGSQSITAKPGDPVKAGSYQQDLSENHIEAQRDIQTGFRSVKDTDIDEIKLLLEGDDEDDNIATRLASIADDLEGNERVGFGVGIFVGLQKQGIKREDAERLQVAINKAQVGIAADSMRRFDPNKTFQTGKLVFREFEGPKPVRKAGRDGVMNTEDDFVRLESPTMTDFEIDTLKSYLTPTQQVRTTLPLGARRAAPTADNTELINALKTRIKRLDDEITKQRQEYEDAKTNYKNLLRGPAINISLGASAVRSSRFGDVLSEFERIRQADPSFAAQIVDASQKRFTVPNVYDDIETLDNVEGQSPIKAILDSNKNIDIIAGMSGEKGGQITDQDLDVIVQDANRLAGLFNTGLFKDQKFDLEVDYLGQKIPLNEYFQLVPQSIQNEQNRKRKLALAQSHINAMRNLEVNLSSEQLDQINRKNLPAAVVADRLDKTIEEIEYAAQNKDSRYLVESLNRLNIDLQNTPYAQRGAGGDEAINIVEQVFRTPANRRNFQVTGTRLKMLRDGLNAVAAKSTLGATQYDIPAIPKIPETTSTDGDVFAVGSEAEVTQDGQTSVGMDSNQFTLPSETPTDGLKRGDVKYSELFGSARPGDKQSVVDNLLGLLD